MAREGIEIHTQFRDIHRHMRYGLRAIDQDQSVRLMRHNRHLRHRIDRSQHIGYMYNPNQTRTFIQQRFVGFQIQPSIIGYGNEFQLQTNLLGQDLPRHNVGVMLHFRKQYKVS